MGSSQSSLRSRRRKGTRLDAARGGDADAWSDLVREYGPRLRGYARGRGVRDADDVMQDVFMAAAGRIASFQGDESSFRSWLFSIAYRQIANRHRVAGRETSIDPSLLTGGSSDDPYHEVALGESASAAVRALHVLNEIETDVVLLRVIAELDTEQVAAAVGKEPGNVRVIQSRALSKLRTELRRMGYGTEDQHD